MKCDEVSKKLRRLVNWKMWKWEHLLKFLRLLALWKWYGLYCNWESVIWVPDLLYCLWFNSCLFNVSLSVLFVVSLSFSFPLLSVFCCQCLSLLLWYFILSHFFHLSYTSSQLIWVFKCTSWKLFKTTQECFRHSKQTLESWLTIRWSFRHWSFKAVIYVYTQISQKEPQLWS